MNACNKPKKPLENPKNSSFAQIPSIPQISTFY